MPASLNFKNADRQTDATTLAEIKTIVYEDSTGNKYTFGVDNTTNVFNTFKYDPSGADPEIDYSATATKFMTGGAVAALLGIETNVGEIKTKTDKITDDLGADVTTIKTQVGTDLISGIKAKTDKMPADLGADVNAIKAKTDTIPANLGNKLDEIKTKTDKITDDLGADVTAIETKTDKMPADLKDELIKLTVIGNAINGSDSVTEAAKTVLENSFKQAITDARPDVSNWLKMR